MFCMENLLDLENVESGNRNSCMLNTRMVHERNSIPYCISDKSKWLIYVGSGVKADFL